MPSKSSIRALGEVNLWAKDLDKMTEFYEGVLGLKPIFKNRKHVFLKVAKGYQGHPQVVALFNSRHDGGASPDIAGTALNHVAFSISKRDFESERARLKKLGVEVHVELHSEPHWRSMYFHDPEGNQLELAAYDKDVR